MQSNFIRGVIPVRLAAILLLAAGTTACEVQSQKAPELSGPSELAQAIALTATPDRLPQDGTSQAVVTAIARDDQGKPIANLGLKWSVTSSDGTAVEPSIQISTTDAQGRATTVVTALPAPAQLPSSPVTLSVSVVPVGTDINSSNTRTVVVQLVAPQGTPAANRLPVPAFTIVPAVANVNETITFNASTTTDEGVPCGNRCSYLWNFGDNSNLATAADIVVTRKYQSPGVYTVSLTVIDDRGGVASTSRSVSVAGPAAPVANFSATQVVSPPGTAFTVTFNGTSSTVGAGATIDKYAWSFSDGTTYDTPVVTKTFAGAATYSVTLTVTDSLGRTSTRVTSVVVT